MKVLRLNEASNTDIQNAKEAFNKSTDSNEKLSILKNFLDKTSLNTGVIWPKLEKFGVDFLSKWIESFKWEEAGSSSNPFINFLNYACDRGNGDSVIFDTPKTFATAYNCYAGTDYLNNERSFHYHPLLVKSVYKNSPGDVREIARMWSVAFKSAKNVRELVPVFYESTDFKSTPMKDWVVKSAAQIRDDLSSSGKTVYNDEDTETKIKNLLKDDRSRNIIKNELNKYEGNNLQ